MSRVKKEGRFVRWAVNVSDTMSFNDQIRSSALNSLFDCSGELKIALEKKEQATS